MKKTPKMINLRLKHVHAYWGGKTIADPDVEKEVEKQAERIYQFFYRRVPTLVVRRALAKLQRKSPNLMP